MIEGASTHGSVAVLRYGMVGGGQGAFIGDVHRKAIALDGSAALVAGCFSRSHENTLATGRSLGLDEKRLYRSFDEMAAAALVRKKAGAALSEAELDFPRAEDGLSGVRFIGKCVESSSKGAAWVSL